MEPSKHFDQHIKRTLENLERGYDPGSWDTFEQRLDQAANEQVDDLVKEKLSGLEKSLPPSNWAALEQMIEADETAEIIENEVHLDNMAYEKLHDLEVPNSDHHWALMAKRLEEEFSLRHQLYRYKIAEISLMALLLLTVVRFMPYLDQLFPGETESPVQIDEQQFKPVVPAPAYELDNQQQQIPAAPAQQQEQALPLTTPIASLDAVRDVSATGLTAQTEDTRASNANHLGGTTEPDKSANDQSNSEGLEEIAVRSLGELHNTPSTTSLFKKMVERNLKRSTLSTPGTQNNGDGTPELLASIAPFQVKSAYGWELPVLKDPVLGSSKQLRFSIFTSTNLNLITTPPNQLNVLDTLVPVAPNTTLASGYGGGILLSLKRNKVEFQTGGIYSFKRYIPNTPVFLFETLNYYVKEDFHGIQLDILQIPLNMQYHFKNSGNWRIYGSVGASSHFITSSVYEIKYQRTPTFSAMAPPSSPDDTRSIRQEKDFPEGLFDGGELRDNFYLTANLGVGVERYVSPKWTVFIQPNYQHYLLSKGVGTNRDKIYALSFYLGTKFSLK